jgi:hypothetical protein
MFKQEIGELDSDSAEFIKEIKAFKDDVANLENNIGEMQRERQVRAFEHKFEILV